MPRKERVLKHIKMALKRAAEDKGRASFLSSKHPAKIQKSREMQHPFLWQSLLAKVVV